MAGVSWNFRAHPSDPDPPTRRTRAVAESRWGLRRKCCHDYLDVHIQKQCSVLIVMGGTDGLPSPLCEWKYLKLLLLFFCLLWLILRYAECLTPKAFLMPRLMPVILVLEIWRREDQKFKVVLGCIEVKSSLAMLNTHLKKMSQQNKTHCNHFLHERIKHDYFRDYHILWMYITLKGGIS